MTPTTTGIQSIDEQLQVLFAEGMQKMEKMKEKMEEKMNQIIKDMIGGKFK